MNSLRIRPMRPDEISIAVNWAAAEGWNPGLHDATCFFAADPTGFLMAVLDGEPVATISVVKYGATFGFLGLYIVSPPHRGKGYAGRPDIAARSERPKYPPPPRVGNAFAAAVPAAIPNTSAICSIPKSSTYRSSKIACCSTGNRRTARSGSRSNVFREPPSIARKHASPFPGNGRYIRRRQNPLGQEEHAFFRSSKLPFAKP
jgi:hypothetical protein